MQSMLRWPVWIGIVCDDLQAQRRFYRDVLGLSEAEVARLAEEQLIGTEPLDRPV